MISDKVRDELASLSVQPIIDRLSEAAREELEEKLCIPHCGRKPDVDEKLCSKAGACYRCFQARLFRDYRISN